MHTEPFCLPAIMCASIVVHLRLFMDFHFFLKHLKLKSQLHFHTEVANSNRLEGATDTHVDE